MTLRNKLFLSAVSAALFASAATLSPAMAQAAANFTAGATVSDTQGGAVGTIASVDGDFVILKTDRHEVRLPKSSFTAHEGGFLMAMTRDQVNAAVDQTLASASTKIAVGALVSGSEGSTAGTIESLDDQFVTVKLTSGALVRLPRSAVAPGTNGAIVGMTAAELAAAAGPAPAAEVEAEAEAAVDDPTQ